jgi:iron-sulfur cluster repair protein YtfE (RIC family)
LARRGRRKLPTLVHPTLDRVVEAVAHRHQAVLARVVKEVQAVLVTPSSHMPPAAVAELVELVATGHKLHRRIREQLVALAVSASRTRSLERTSTSVAVVAVASTERLARVDLAAQRVLAVSVVVETAQ